MTNVGAEPNGDLPTQRLNELIAAGENAKQEFKSTLRWDLYRKTNSDEITHACVKTIAAFLNSEGGRLLIGVADDGQIVGLEADKFPNTDKFSLHLFNSLQKHIGASAATGVTVEFLRPAGIKRGLPLDLHAEFDSGVLSARRRRAFLCSNRTKHDSPTPPHRIYEISRNPFLCGNE